MYRKDNAEVWYKCSGRLALNSYKCTQTCSWSCAIKPDHL